MKRNEWLDMMRRITTAVYDRFAHRYWVTWGLAIEQTHEAYLQKFIARLPDNGKVLSAACGAGRFDGPLLAAGVRVVGIDQSEGVLDLARERFPEAEYVRMPLHEMPFESEFDGVLCMDAMEHVFPEEYPGIIKLFRQALRPGGALYFTADREEDPDFDLDFYFETAKSAGYPVMYGEVFDPEAYALAMADIDVPDEITDRGVYHYYPPLEKVRQWVLEAGLDIVEEGEGNGFHHFLARSPTLD